MTRLNNIMDTRPTKRLKHLLSYGNIWMYILSLIKEKKEVYAYTLDKQLEEEFFFRPNRIMLYVVLYKLEDEGIIKGKQKTIERRKYYVLTKKGEGVLKFTKEYLNTLSKRL